MAVWKIFETKKILIKLLCSCGKDLSKNLLEILTYENAHNNLKAVWKYLERIKNNSIQGSLKVC